MKKRLTEEQYKEAISGLDVSDQTLEIAHGVLVSGYTQAQYVKQLGVTKGAVWQAVMRVWQAHESKIPRGFEKVTVILPDHQAYIVKKWAKEAQKRSKQ